MAKKSFSIIDNKKKSTEFLAYLENKVGTQVNSFLHDLSTFSDVLIFSGVIRNYFIKYKGELRDFDIVVNSDHDRVEKFLSRYEYQHNSFGGYKITIDALKIDLWYIEQTWAYTNHKLIPDLFKAYNLPNTAFFNFSSVVFDYNKHLFILNSNFKHFLRTKEIDLVLEDNPLPQLCIVNTVYYKQKFKFKISERLQAYCIEHFNDYTESDFEKIQIKHFSEVKYPYLYLKVYMSIFEKNLLKFKKEKISKHP